MECVNTLFIYCFFFKCELNCGNIFFVIDENILSHIQTFLIILYSRASFPKIILRNNMLINFNMFTESTLNAQRVYEKRN